MNCHPQRIIGILGGVFLSVMAWAIATQQETAQGIGPTVAISILSMM
jgi:hypothetical protein